MTKVAILVDGGFYRRISNNVKGHKTAKEKADELYGYCLRHLKGIHKEDEYDELYRIFYYDSAPLNKVVYHPLTKKNIDFSRLDSKKWAEDFYSELSRKRKVALRFGELSDGSAAYNIKAEN